MTQMDATAWQWLLADVQAVPTWTMLAFHKICSERSRVPGEPQNLQPHCFTDCIAKISKTRGRPGRSRKLSPFCLPPKRSSLKRKSFLPPQLAGKLELLQHKGRVALVLQHSDN
jgi:hypothetical protein